MSNPILVFALVLVSVFALRTTHRKDRCAGGGMGDRGDENEGIDKAKLSVAGCDVRRKSAKRIDIGPEISRLLL